MYPLSWVTGTVLIAAAITHAGELSIDLTTIDRTIKKEPTYKSEPRYALIVIGPRADHRAWLVMDGNDLLYIDRNDNGDLTESDERVELDLQATKKMAVNETAAVTTMHVFSIGDVAGSKLQFWLWVRNPVFDASKFPTPEIATIYQDMYSRGWWNGSLKRFATDGMQAQIPLALTTKAEDAQVCHLLGPLTFTLRREDQHVALSPKMSVLDVSIGTRCLPPRGWSHEDFDFSPLTTSEVPATLHPVATIEYASSVSSTKIAPQELTLDQRCCGDGHFTKFTAPEGAISGMAKVSVTFPLWAGHPVKPAEFEIPIK